MKKAQNTWYESMLLCEGYTIDKLTKKQLVQYVKATSRPLKHKGGKLPEVFFTIFFQSL